ncbi:MAG TPA: flagellar hook-basal body complex protein FliE [Pseudomonas sp.]|nr:flagellar hook-basal body complex protein FliE [Pseudomonas sp.]
MNSLMQVQQDMLGRMDQIKTLSEGSVIKPAQLFEAQPQEGFAVAFDNVLQAVDNQQHQASAAAAAVDSGKSDDLVGAMIESQKASVSFTALLQVRNKITTAFEEVMRMPM